MVTPKICTTPKTAPPLGFIFDYEQDCFFIGESVQSVQSVQSDLSVRLSMDDVLLKTRPAQLIKFKPPKQISIKSYLPQTGFTTKKEKKSKIDSSSSINEPGETSRDGIVKGSQTFSIPTLRTLN